MLNNIFSQIQNGFLAKKAFIVLKLNSKFLINFLNILIKEGYLYGYKFFKNNYIIIFLKFRQFKPSLTQIKKTQKNIYLNKKKVFFYKTSLFTYIISTPKGLMSQREAIKQKQGGCLICKII